MKTLALIFTFTFSLGGFAGAADTISVNEAVEIGLRQNPALRSAALEEESARAGKLKAWSAQLPHVGISAQHNVKNEFQVLHVPFNVSSVSPRG